MASGTVGTGSTAERPRLEALVQAVFLPLWLCTLLVLRVTVLHLSSPRLGQDLQQASG